MRYPQGLVVGAYLESADVDLEHEDWVIADVLRFDYGATSLFDY